MSARVGVGPVIPRVGTSPGPLRELGGGRGLGLLLGGLLGPAAVLTSFHVREGRLVLPLLAVTLWALLALAALARPRIAVLVALAVVVLVPVYYGRYVVGAVAVTPQAAAALVLLPQATRGVRGFRPVPLDLAVAGFVALRCASYLLNYRSGPGAAIGVLLGVALPYVVFRLCVQVAWLPAMSRVVVACATVLSVVAIRERLGFGNPFFTLLTPTYQAQSLARANERLGAVRGEASFGEPISFGMFLGLALGLAVMLAVTALRRSDRVLALVASGVIAYGVTTTQSRGALLVAGLAVLGWLLASASRLDVLRIGSLALLGAVVVLGTPVVNSVERLVSSSAGDTRESRSAQYRLEVLEVVREPTAFSLLGRATAQTEGEGVTRDLQRRVGLKSIDSHYALVYLDTGLLGLLAFLSVTGLALAGALRPGLPPAGRAWAVGLAATLGNLLTVALFTQESDVVWIATAVTAVLGAGRGEQA